MQEKVTGISGEMIVSAAERNYPGTDKKCLYVTFKDGINVAGIFVKDLKSFEKIFAGEKSGKRNPNGTK